MAPRSFPLLSPGLLGHPFRYLIQTAKMLALAHLFWEYGYSLGPASGPSMLPTFRVINEQLLISKRHRNGRGVRVGDLVVYEIPIFPDSNGIKRVVGMPGDYVLLNTPGSGSDAMIQVRLLFRLVFLCLRSQWWPAISPGG